MKINRHRRDPLEDMEREEAKRCRCGAHGKVAKPARQQEGYFAPGDELRCWPCYYRGKHKDWRDALIEMRILESAHGSGAPTAADR